MAVLVDRSLGRSPKFNNYWTATKGNNKIVDEDESSHLFVSGVGSKQMLPWLNMQNDSSPKIQPAAIMGMRRPMSI